MTIRKTQMTDWEALEDLYACARNLMRNTGNPTQWGDNRPPKDSIRKDIEEGNHYVILEQGEICGAFSYILGIDPTYLEIEDGKWLDEDAYGTIHKLASNGKVKGIFEECLAFCQKMQPNIRIDTHADNKIMQHLVEKNGFVRCGIIYVDDGTPRIAYQIKRGEANHV